MSSYRADRSLPDLSTVAAACPLAKQPRLWAVDVAGGNGEGEAVVNVNVPVEDEDEEDDEEGEEGSDDDEELDLDHLQGSDDEEAEDSDEEIDAEEEDAAALAALDLEEAKEKEQSKFTIPNNREVASVGSFAMPVVIIF